MCCQQKRTLQGLPQCLRWSMFALNILLFVSAALTLGYASYLLSSEWNLLALGNLIPIIMFISFGVLLIVSCLGSLATYRLSRALLLVYSFVLFLCFILQIAIIVSIITSNNILNEEWLEDRWADLSEADQEWIEAELKCCGFNENASDTTCSNYTDYCESKVKSYIKDMRLMGMILGLIIIVFEVVGVIVNCVLIRSLKVQIEKGRNDSYVKYSYHDEPNKDYWRL